MRSPTFLGCALLAALCAFDAASQGALLRRDGNLFAVAAADDSLDAVVARLFAGPTPAERAAGLTTAIPAGTRLVAIRQRGDRVTLTLSSEFASTAASGGHIEDAVEQITKTVLRAGPARTVHLEVATADGVIRNLDEVIDGQRQDVEPDSTTGALPPAPAAVPGALSGRTIAVSPGHGYYWHTSLGWTTQRGAIGGLTEDIHTNEIAMRYLMPALENMGARVFSCRERGEILQERIADNDTGAPTYTETGAWTTSASAGYSGGTYRFAGTSLTTTASATWDVPIAVDGIYPVYVFFRASANRSTDVRFVVSHSGGSSEVIVDQTRDDRRWTFIGNYSFTRTAGATITLENRSANPGPVVIADAVRVGAGYGSIVRGSGTSGRPRWQECCRYWAQFAGAPSTVYDIAGCSDNCDDVTARPKYAEWRGADAYISLHTNAGGGTGTSSFIHDTSPTPGSAALQTAIHTQIVSDIRSMYCSTWVDRGRRSANFGEVRELNTMPGVLLELAFHDQPGSKDHDALHDPRFRFISGRAYARGVLRYFAPSAPFPPVAPTALAVTQDGNRGLRVSWNPSPGATGYSIEQSPDGVGFVEVAQAAGTTWSTGPLPHGTVLSFRVRAFGSSGRSFPTETLTAGTSHTGRAELLLVQGFDRLGRTVKFPDNTFNYLRLHADAIRRSREFSLGFDAASNEAVMQGRTPLANYRAVDWACGEESTADETFSSLEQSLVSAYMQAGGRLLVSGAEIGWDLDANGSAADRAFYSNVLGAIYVRDDAGTYGFRPTGGALSGLPAGMFDNGQGPTYNVDWPDVISPSNPASTINMIYDVGGGAGLQRINGSSRVVHMGFPLETILDPDLRSDVMTRALRFLLAPRELENGASVALGGSLPLAVELPGEAGAPYVLLSSLGLGTIPVGTHVLPLFPDGIFGLSLTPGSGVFVNFQGTLNGAGRATGTFVVPNLGLLSGLDFYFSGFTLTPAPAIRTVMPWTRVSVQ